MKKAKQQLKRIIACCLCILMLLGVLDISVFALTDSQVVQDEEGGTGFYLAHANVDIFDEGYFPEHADIYEEEEYYRNHTGEIAGAPLVSATRAASGDPWVRNTQLWLKQEYSDIKAVKNMVVDGLTGLGTVTALLAALQKELKVDADGQWGSGTDSAYKKSLLTPGMTNRKVAILQGALICKGYDPGHIPTEQDGKYIFQDNFDESVEKAVKQLQADANINTNGIVSSNLMKALMSMDSFKLLPSYGGQEVIRNFQRYLNATYESFAGLSPCDGVYGRNTNRAVLKALQAEQKLTGEAVDGIWGDKTKTYCPQIPYVKNSSATKSYEGNYYTADEIRRFTKLMQFALYANGFGSGEFNGIFDSDTSQALRDFQKHHVITITGKADIGTWMSLLISSGDRSRSAKGADCMMNVTQARAKTLYDQGYRYIGRYLTGSSKAITRDEAQTIFAAGLRFFPIYQSSGNKIEYFTSQQGTEDAEAAIKAATALGLPKGTIIYFAVDCDATDSQISSRIIPYFEKVNETISLSSYKTGIYGTRNVCSRVSARGYSCSSFVGDMSTGFSGNLGFKMPADWAFDQFANCEKENAIGTGDGRIEIDKDAVSGRDQGVGHLEAAATDNSVNLDFGTPQSDTLYGPTIDFLGNEIPLFAIDMGFNLTSYSGLVETYYDHSENNLEVIIGKRVLGHSIEIGGGSEKVGKFKQAYREVKDLFYSMNKSTTEFTRKFRDMKGSLYNRGTKVGFDFDTYLVGYYTFNLSTGNLVEGGSALVGDLNTSIAWPLIPTLYLKLQLEGSLQTGFKFILNTEDSNINFFGDIGFMARLSIGIEQNLLIANAYGGVSGSFDCAFKFPVSSFEESAEVKINATIFFEWGALLWGDRYDLVLADKQLYPNNGAKTLSISPSDLKFINPLPQTMRSNTSVPGVFRNNMQPYCLPQIISLGNGKMFMAYIEDESNASKRIAQNRTKLMYSIYDGSLWSEPQPVLDDGTVDFEPSICPDGNGGVHILWQNGTKDFAPDVSLDEMAAGIDLYYTHWNGNSFENTVAVTNNNQRLEIGAKIVSDGNDLTVVWQENSENDSFGLSGTNSIFRKQFKGGAWKNTETIASDLGVINSLDSTYMNTNNVIAYTGKASDDTSTVNDLELYYFDGYKTTRMTNDDTPDYSATFLNHELYWISGQSIVSVTNGNLASKSVAAENIGANVSKIKAIGDSNGAKSIVWEQNGSAGPNFYGVNYNASTDSFGTVHPLSTNSGVIRGWDAAMLPNGQIEMAYCFAEKYEEPVDGKPYGPLDLMQTFAEPFYDISVDTIATYEGEVAAGKEIKVSANIYNAGSAPVDQFSVKVTDDDSTVKTLTVDKALAVGESAELEFLFELPSTITRKDYQIEIFPVGGDDVSLLDNEAIFSVGFADLLIDDIHEVRTNSGRQLQVTVKNSGFSTTSPATLKLLKESAEGEIYASKAVAKLAPSESTIITFDIPNSDLDADIAESARSFYLALDSADDELNYGNNSELVYLYPDYSISLTAGNGGTVQGAGKYEYKSTACITAIPDPGYIFDGWYENGNCLYGVSATYDMDVHSNRTLEARFKPNNLKITNIEVLGSVEQLEPLTFIATAVNGEGPFKWSYYVYLNDTLCYEQSNSDFDYFMYTPSSAGLYTLTARVVDSTGYAASIYYYYDGQSWITDNYGNDFDSASDWEISPNGIGRIDGVFEYANDVDVFKFIVPSSGIYLLNVSNISSDYLINASLYDKNRNQLHLFNYVGSTSFPLSYHLNAGEIYYLETGRSRYVNEKSCAYTISLEPLSDGQYYLCGYDMSYMGSGLYYKTDSAKWDIKLYDDYCTISRPSTYPDGETLYLTCGPIAETGSNPYCVANIYTTPYSGSSNQKWVIVGNQFRPYDSDPSDNVFLGLDKTQQRPYPTRLVKVYTGTTNWDLINAAPVVKSGIYKIKNDGSNLYLGTGDAGITQNWSGDFWNVEQQSDGYYKISNNNRTAQVLTYDKDTGRIQSIADEDEDNQRWMIAKGADGAIRLSPKSDIGRIMAVQNSSVDANAEVILQEDGFESNGKWFACDISEESVNPAGVVPNGVYEIQDMLSGKLIHAASGSMAAPAHLWESAATDNQRLQFECQNDGTYKITVLSSGAVLTVPGSSRNHGVQLQFYAWNGGDHQRWYVVDCGGGFFKLINKYSGLAIDISESGSANGTKIQQWEDTSAPAQRFRLLPTHPVASIKLNDGVYELQGKTSGKLIHASSGLPGASAHLWESANTDNQRLRLEHQDDGTYKITVLSSGSVLTVRDASSSNGALLDFSTWHGDDQQKWYIVDCVGGFVKFINKHSGLAIDISDNGTANGTRIQQWQDVGVDAQRFRILPIDLPSASMNIEDGVYTIMGETSGKLIEAAGWSNGTVAQLWEQSGTYNQNMRFERQSDGTYKITAFSNGKALTDPNSYVNGAQLLFLDWTGGDHQKWYIIDCGNGYIKLINKFSGLAIDISENGTANGTKVQQWKDTDVPAQRLKLILT